MRSGGSTPKNEDARMSADALLPLSTALNGDYEIQREIGRGDMATVYLARRRRVAAQTTRS